LRVWSEWCVFSQEQLRSYYDTFLDTSKPPPKTPSSHSSSYQERERENSRYHSSHSRSRHSLSHDFDDEIDGVPMTEEEYDAVMNESSSEEDYPDHHEFEEKRGLVDGDLKPLVAEYLDTV